MCKPVKPLSEALIAAGLDSQILLDGEEETSEERKGRQPRNRKGRTRGSKHDPSTNNPIIVQHSYHDHVHETTPTSMEPSDLKLRCTSTTPFPVKLHSILDEVAQDGLAHVFSWQPHGRSFVIHKPKEFIKIIPKYYNKLSKIASFQRQLNLYGFQRLTRGLDKGGYYHEYFLRHKEHLALKIPRTKIKGTGVRGKSNPEQEPDFWSMDWADHDEDANKMDPSSPAPLQDSRNQEQMVLPTGSSSNMQPQHFEGGLDFPAQSITEWGRSFYSLELQPEEIVPTNRSAATGAPPTSDKCWGDIDDQSYLDELLGSMADAPARKSGGDDLGFILDRITS